MQVLRPGDEAELAAMVGDAAANGRTLLVEGSGSRAAVGRPVEAQVRLDLSAFAGVVDYDPTELVLTARAATPLDEVEALLDANGQMLAFEPPRHGALLGAPEARPTLGGAVAANAAGPRRLVAGAARDHLLGFRAVSGRGEAFKAGGKVVKNVTGFDLSKLMAGSWGTLAVLTEVSVKVLPKPRTSATLLLHGLAAPEALKAIAEACGSPAAVSGAAWLPAALARRSVVGGATSLTALRLEGFEASVEPRLAVLEARLRHHAPTRLPDAESRALWRQIADVHELSTSKEPLWRLTGLGERAALPGLDSALIDWGGMLVWSQGAEAPNDSADLWRGPEDLRARRGGARAPSAAQARLAAELKRAFDPADILNRGRLHPALEASA